jgi:hypothetical protein
VVTHAAHVRFCDRGAHAADGRSRARGSREGLKFIQDHKW